MADQQQLLDPGTARPKRRPPRREGDAYYTIVEATAALIQEFPEIAGELLFDPTCGDGRMARQLMEARRFRACHLNDLNGPDALSVPGCALASAHDACSPDLWIGRPRPDAVVTNPPWESAGTIAWAALRVAPIVALLLRCTWGEPCGSSPKAPRGGRMWLKRRPPDALLMMDRISYIGTGETDSAPSWWFIWGVKPRIAVVDLADVGQLGLQVGDGR